MDYYLWLYKEGDECEGVTGGWESIGLDYNTTYNTAVAPTLTRNENNMTLHQTTDYDSYNSGVVKTVNKIPLADANYVHFSVVNAVCSETWAIVLGLIMENIAGTVEDSTTSKVIVLGGTTDPASGVFTIDVSSITDDCYIGISLYQESTVIVDRIWVE